MTTLLHMSKTSVAPSRRLWVSPQSSVLGITLARGGSKGVPRKNIREVAGKPLIAWTIEEALKCTLIDRYIVSSDDEEILRVALESGAEVVKRPPDLADDMTPSRDALIHALDWCEDRYDEQYDIVADLRCTNPLKTAFDIDQAIAKLRETGADAVIGVTQLEDHHPRRIKRIFKDRLVDIWPEDPAGNRQDLEPVYIRNGSIYIVLSDALRAGVHFTGSEEIRPWIMPRERGWNVDDEADLRMVEILLEMRK